MTVRSALNLNWNGHWIVIEPELERLAQKLHKMKDSFMSFPSTQSQSTLVIQYFWPLSKATEPIHISTYSRTQADRRYMKVTNSTSLLNISGKPHKMVERERKMINPGIHLEIQ